MIVRSLQDMVGGWIVGNFEPTCLKTTACEVACKHYDAGAAEAAHVHRIATEMTLDRRRSRHHERPHLRRRRHHRARAGRSHRFSRARKTTTVVVKMPSVLGDKYPVAAGGPQ